jgi:putative tryptophan/tyrosine transport system substrate-binding protein
MSQMSQCLRSLVLARPGGNFTGLFLDLPELSGKQIELLKEVVPRLAKPGVLWDSAIGEAQFRAAQTAAHASLGSAAVVGLKPPKPSALTAGVRHGCNTNS